MTPLSPQSAAREGFRLLRREPMAFIVWTAMWLATFSAAAWVVAASTPVKVGHAPAPSNFADVITRFGPYAAGLIGMFLIVWLVTAVAAFPGVLHPHHRRGGFFCPGAEPTPSGL